MTTQIRRLPPIWLMGFANMPLGVAGAVLLITLPQLLAANGVPEAQIASVTAIALIPGFAGFLLAPLLDWRFSRRFYAIVLALAAGVMLFAALLEIRDLRMLTVLGFLGMTAIQLYVAAVGGWLGGLVSTEAKGKLGAWFAVANTASGGVTSIVAILVLRELPYALGAALLGLLNLLPLLIFPWLPAPPADRKLASERFRDFFRDVLALLRRRSVLLTLLLFVMPCSAFALTNTLGGLGKDYGASERMVGLVGGAGVTIAGVVGSLLVPPAIKRLSPWPVYLLIGGLGALFTLTLIVSPRTPAVFALAMLGENVFQAAAFAVQYTIVLRTIGEDNPLAATQYGLLVSASVLPIAYMQAVDGAAYGGRGIVGSYLADALLSLAACLAMAVVLGVIHRRAKGRAL